MAEELRAHWDKVYEETPVERVGWYEAVPELSLELIERCGVGTAESVLDAGAGASTLTDELLARGWERVVALDLSASALRLTAARLGPAAEKVTFVPGDIRDAAVEAQIPPVSIWHDRALLHFLTSPKDREAYAMTVRRTVRPGGWVIIATFALNGAEYCSGLPVQRSDAGMLGELLGPDFELVEAIDYVYRQPWGDERPYVYTRFRRKGETPAG